MQPEPCTAMLGDPSRSIEPLALTLLTIGADQSVRVLEAMAAALVNRARQRWGHAHLGLSEPPPATFRGAAVASASGQKLQLCRRIARRALRGSLADPTLGATAFHRLESGPAWARDLLPVATFGSFLFYELPATE
jgi:hypothetical protein